MLASTQQRKRNRNSLTGETPAGGLGALESTSIKLQHFTIKRLFDGFELFTLCVHQVWNPIVMHGAKDVEDFELFEDDLVSCPWTLLFGFPPSVLLFGDRYGRNQKRQTAIAAARILEASSIQIERERLSACHCGHQWQQSRVVRVRRLHAVHNTTPEGKLAQVIRIVSIHPGDANLWVLHFVCIIDHDLELMERRRRICHMHVLHDLTLQLGHQIPLHICRLSLLRSSCRILQT